MRGEPTGELIAEIDRLTPAGSEPAIPSSREAAIGDEAFGSGKLAVARQAWHRVAELSPMNATDSMARGARAALWLRDGSAARADLEGITAAAVHGAVVDADKLTVRAGLAALEGRGSEALALYREALSTWRHLGSVWDEALCGLDMALLLDPSEPDVHAAAVTAREILVHLGATRFIERLDQALDASPEPSVPPTSREPAPSPGATA